MSCRLRVVAGDVEVRLEHDAHEGRCPLPRQAQRLLTLAVAALHAAPTSDEPDGPTPTFGFTAVVERAEPVEPDFSWFFEEEE